MVHTQVFSPSRWHLRALVAFIVILMVAAVLVVMPAKEPAHGQSSPPPAPELSSASSTHNSVRLKWWAEESPADSGMTYRVERMQSGSSYRRVQGIYGDLTHYGNGGVGISFTNSGLRPDTYYTYRVYAIQGALQSAPSSAILAQTDPAPAGYTDPYATPEATPAPTPEPVENPVVQQTPSPTPPQQGDRPDSEGSGENDIPPLIGSDSEGSGQNDIPPLKGDVVDDNDGGQSDDIETRTVINVNGNSVNGSSVVLTWSVRNTTGIDKYRIWHTRGANARAIKDSGGKWIVETPTGVANPPTIIEVDTTTNTRSHTITNLDSNTRYYFWVAGVDGTVVKQPSARMTLVTQPTSNAPPAPRNLEVTVVTGDAVAANNGIKMVWEAPETIGSPCTVTGYSVTKWSLSVAGVGSARKHDTGTDTITGTNTLTYTWPLTALRPDDTYVVGVQAACDGDVYGDRATDAAETPPAAGQPEQPDLFWPGGWNNQETGVNLLWYTAENPRDASNNWQFKVQRRQAGTGAWATLTTTNGKTGEFVNGGYYTTWQDTTAEPVTGYWYRIITVQSTLESAPSTQWYVLTKSRRASGAPDAPTGLTYTLSGSKPNRVLTLSWTAPADVGRSAITDYQIIQNGEVLTKDAASTATTLAIDEGSKLGAYVHTFYVRAINAQGAGRHSDPLTVNNLYESGASSSAVASLDAPDRPARAGTVRAELKTTQVDRGGTMVDASILRVEWTDGTGALGDETATARACHTDYNVYVGKAGVYNHLGSTPATGTITSITGNFPPNVILGSHYTKLSGTHGPYARRAEATLPGKYGTAGADAGAGEVKNDLSIKVVCGQLSATPSSSFVEIGEDTTVSVVTTFASDS